MLFYSLSENDRKTRPFVSLHAFSLDMNKGNLVAFFLQNMTTSIQTLIDVPKTFWLSLSFMVFDLKRLE